MRYRLGILVSVLVLTSAAAQAAERQVVSLTPKRGNSFDTCVIWKWGKEFRERVSEDWAPISTTTAKKTTVEGIEGNGFLYLVRIDKSSGDAQFDFDCLQAVLGAACFSEDNSAGILNRYIQSFDSKKAITRTGQLEGINRFFTDHPNDTKDQTLTYYKIPLDVLKRFPGLFSEQELLDTSNIGTITNESTNRVGQSALEKLVNVYSGIWIPFFVKHPNATKQEIFDIASKLQNH
jgi:hypothetical protein